MNTLMRTTQIVSIALTCLVSSNAQAAALSRACFLSDGTLVSATSGQLAFTDPISDTQKVSAPNTPRINSILCNPKRPQVLIYHGYNSNSKMHSWSAATIVAKPLESMIGQQSGRSPKQDVEIVEISALQATTGGTSGYSQGIAFESEGEAIVARSAGKGVIVLSASDFRETGSLAFSSLTPHGDSHLIAIESMHQGNVSALVSLNRQDWIYQFPSTMQVTRVVWNTRTNAVSKDNTVSNLAPYRDLRLAAIDDSSAKRALFDSIPGVGSVFGNLSQNFNFRDVDGREAILKMSGYINHAFLMLSKSEAISFWDCPGGSQAYLLKGGSPDKQPIGSCGAINPAGDIAVDHNRGYIFAASRGRPDRLLKLPELVDVRAEHFASLQQRFGVQFRTAFLRSNPKERYVPSVSNTRSYSETLFYVGGTPVTRYVDHTVTQSEFKETVDVYDLVYEIRNNFSKPLVIRFRVDGLAKSSEWAVKTLGGGFLQGLLGGRFSTQNVRERENITIPIRLERTVALLPGESFKARDVWGEKPGNSGDLSIQAVEVNEVSEVALRRIGDIIGGKIPATQENISSFLEDSKFAWAADRLIAINSALEASERSKRLASLSKQTRVTATLIPKDFDPDFDTPIEVVIQNGNDSEVKLVVSIEGFSTNVVIGARSQTKAVVQVRGVSRKLIQPRLSLSE